LFYFQTDEPYFKPNEDKLSFAEDFLTKVDGNSSDEDNLTIDLNIEVSFFKLAHVLGLTKLMTVLPLVTTGVSRKNLFFGIRVVSVGKVVLM